MFSLSLVQKGLLLLFAILLLESLYLGGLRLAVEQAESEAAAQSSSRHLLESAQQLTALFYRVKRCAQKMLAPENDNSVDDERAAFKNLSEQFRQSIQELILQLRANPELVERAQGNLEPARRVKLDIVARESEALFAQTIPWLDDVAAARDKEERTAIRSAAYRDIRPKSVEIEDTLVLFLEYQQKMVLALPSPHVELTRSLSTGIWLGLAANAVVAIALSAFFALSITRKLSVMDENTVRLRAGSVLLPPIRGKDELAELDEAFHQMAHQMARNDELRRTYILLFKRDLQHPLSFVRDQLDGLNDQFSQTSPPVVGRLLVTAVRNLTRLIVIVEDLASIYERSSSSMALKPGPAVPAELVDRAMEAVAQLASRHKSKLSVENSLSAEQINVDGDRIVQVLINFLSNAIKYSPEGSDICVQINRIDEFVELAVKDQGRGIPPEQLVSVFERFKQVSAQDGRRGVGTGLGLSICKQIVELHGGAIGVESVPGTGSRFWLKLNVTAEQSAEQRGEVNP